MRDGIMSQMTRPEEGERGSGASHRRGGTGWDSYRRPPEGSHLRNFPEGKRGASATSKAPGAERKVESMRDKGAKLTANRKLHIDDGCMGGGNIIPFEEFVSWVNNPNSSQGIGIHSLGWLGGRTVTTKQSIEGMYKNEYDMTPNDGKDTYFTQSRKGIFHYCVIGAYAGYERKAGSDTVPHGRGAMAGKRDLPADLDGDFFCVWGKAMTGKYDCDEWWASMWMHELGHCLGLDADAYYNSKGKEISDSIYPSRMRYGRDKGDKGFIDYSGKTGSIEVYKSDGTKYSGVLSQEM